MTGPPLFLIRPMDGRARWPAFMTGGDVEDVLNRGRTGRGPVGGDKLRRKGTDTAAGRPPATGGTLVGWRSSSPRRWANRSSRPKARSTRSAWNCEYVAENAEGWLASQIVPTQAVLSYVAHRPLGLGPCHPAVELPPSGRSSAAPCRRSWPVILSCSSPRPMCPIAPSRVTDLMRRAGIPTGVFENLDIPVDLIGDLIADRRVAAVAFTGSPTAGATVAARAGSACKKSILELGGSDAFIVLADANLEANCLGGSQGVVSAIAARCAWPPSASWWRRAIEGGIYGAVRRGNRGVCASETPGSGQRSWVPWHVRTCATSWIGRFRSSIAQGARIVTGSKKTTEDGVLLRTDPAYSRNCRHAGDERGKPSVRSRRSCGYVMPPRRYGSRMTLFTDSRRWFGRGCRTGKRPWPDGCRRAAYSSMG